MLLQLALFLILFSALAVSVSRARRAKDCVAFFHPRCDELGGGERVLWCIVHALLQAAAGSWPPGNDYDGSPNTNDSRRRRRADDGGAARLCGGSPRVREVVIYCLPSVSPSECLQKVKDRLGIDLSQYAPRRNNSNADDCKKGADDGEVDHEEGEADNGEADNGEVDHEGEADDSEADHDGEANYGDTTNSKANNTNIYNANNNRKNTNNHRKNANRRNARSDDSTVYSSTNSVSLRFLPLQSARLLNSANFPFATLLLESLCSMLVAFDALFRCTPRFFVDTTGYSFTLIIATLFFGCRSSCYIHYPIVSTDMLKAVERSIPRYNNRALFARSAFWRTVKLWYYRGFASFYSICGGYMETCLVNSTWTYAHINELMASPQLLTDDARLASREARAERLEPRERLAERPLDAGRLLVRLAADAMFPPLKSLTILYPPCDIEAFQRYAKPSGSRANRIVSLSQFRPEKNHTMQIHAIGQLLQLYKTNNKPVPKNLELVICGATRNNSSDEALVDELRRVTASLGLENYVRFAVNLSFDEVCQILGSSKIGIHTMVQEHFGIAVVELLAAGLLVAAHNSGGPQLDVLQHTTVEEKDGSSSDLSEECILVDLPRRRIVAEKPPCEAAPFGFLCSSAAGFAEAIYHFLTDPEGSNEMLLRRARESLCRFSSNEEFGRKCVDKMHLLRR